MLKTEWIISRFQNYFFSTRYVQMSNVGQFFISDFAFTQKWFPENLLFDWRLFYFDFKTHQRVSSNDIPDEFQIEVFWIVEIWIIKLESELRVEELKSSPICSFSLWCSKEKVLRSVKLKLLFPISDTSLRWLWRALNRASPFNKANDLNLNYKVLCWGRKFLNR